MDTARVEIIVPKDMMPYIIASSPENDLKRNAIRMTYLRCMILGVPYLSIDISEIDRDVETYYSLVGTEA